MPSEPWSSQACSCPNRDGSYVTDDTSMFPVAPFANSSRIIAESSAGSNGAPSGRAARGTICPNTAVTATTSPNSQVAM